MTALLDVEGLSVRLPGRRGMTTIVEEVSYRVEPGQVFGLAGESGSGKTVSSLALLGLLPSGAEVRGRAVFEGSDLLQHGRRQLRRVRGARIAVVFQDPMTSLHPMLTIERQLTDHLRHHRRLRRRAARERAVELLEQVRIPNPGVALSAFPHQFSGGMRQRIAIAVALACRPSLLIADEPTTALDVTVQAGIMRLLDDLRREEGLSLILITHDLGVLSSMADWLTVLYAGRVVESGPTRAVLSAPRHPYTDGLLKAVPRLDGGLEPLVPIAGRPAGPHDRPPGCAFNPRCAYAVPRCAEEVPKLVSRGGGRATACPVDPLAAA